MGNIHVAYALDDNYAVPTCVSMASMLVNTQAKVHFHVISKQLSDENKAKISRLGEKFHNGEWSFYGFGFDTSIMKTTNYLTVETYFRIYLPLLLPQLERVIYIDGDTIVTGDISELWNVDLGDNAVGIVPHCFRSELNELRKKILGLSSSEPYCNAGVLLMNLKRFKALDIHSSLHELIESLLGKFNDFPKKLQFYADQEILNYALNKSKKHVYLPYAFNVLFAPAESPTLGEAGFGLAEIAAALSRPIIIHYSGARAIWTITNCLHKVDIPTLKQYYHYKSLTQFFDPSDDTKLEQYISNYNWTLYKGSLSYGMFIDVFYRETYEHAVNAIKSKAQGKQIVYYGYGKQLKTIMIFFAANDIYPDKVVDGSPAKQGVKLCDYLIESPQVLLESPDKYFIVLTTQSQKTTAEIKAMLISHGISENNIYHAFKFATDRVNASII